MVLLLLLSTMLLACMPLLFLVEYVFEVTNSDVITLFKIKFHSPVYYLESLGDFTGKLYSLVGKHSALCINYIHSLNLPELYVQHVGLFWKCVKKITQVTFKTVLPFENFKKNFISNLNPDVVHFSPRTLLRTKRQRQFNNEDMIQSTILEKMQSLSTQAIDESTKQDLEQFTNDSKTGMPNTVSLIDATTTNNVIVKDQISKYIWEKTIDNIDGDLDSKVVKS